MSAFGLLGTVAMIWLRIAVAGAFPGDRALARWSDQRPPSVAFNDVSYFIESWAALPVAATVVAVAALIVGRRLGHR